MDIIELRRRLNELLAEMRQLHEGASREQRGLTDTEQARWNELDGQATNLQAEIDRAERLALHGGNTQAASQAPASQIGMSTTDLRNYRITRAINALIRRDWRGAELEFEASQAVARRLGREPQGFFVPYDVQTQRALDTTTGAGAAETSYGSMIDVLRNSLVLRQAGATFLTGLTGTFHIPKVSGKHQWYWVGEGLAPTQSNVTVGQVELAPKTIGAWNEYTRQFLAQTSLDAEMFLRNDIALMLAEGLEYTGFHGNHLTDPNSPDGLEYVAGVNTPAGGLSWAGVVNLETAVAVANAAAARMAYITNAKVRGKLKQTPKVANTDSRMVWDDQAGSTPINGYPALVTNVIRDNAGDANNESELWYGNWAMLLIGSWGTIDLLVDPYSQSTTGKTRVVGFMEADVKSRHAEGFGFTKGPTN